MNILSLDAVTPQAGVAVAVAGEIVYARSWDAGRNHAREVPVEVEKAMGASGLSFRDLNLIAVAVGPGSYTGIRIGIALAKGISTGCGARTLGMSTLEQLAYAARDWDGPICAAMPVGRDRIGWALFRTDSSEWHRLTPDSTAATDEDFALPDGTLLVGPAKSLLKAPNVHILPAEDHTEPSILIELVLNLGLGPDPGPLTPNYLRSSTPEERAGVPA